MGSVWDVPSCVCCCVCLCAGRPKGALEAAAVDWRAHVWCGWEIKHTLDECESGVGGAPLLRFWSRLGWFQFTAHAHTHTHSYFIVSHWQSECWSSTFIYFHSATFLCVRVCVLSVRELVTSNEVNLLCGAKTSVCLYLCDMVADYSHHSQHRFHFPPQPSPTLPLSHDSSAHIQLHVALPLFTYYVAPCQLWRPSLIPLTLYDTYWFIELELLLTKCTYKYIISFFLKSL